LGPRRDLVLARGRNRSILLSVVSTFLFFASYVLTVLTIGITPPSLKGITAITVWSLVFALDSLSFWRLALTLSQTS